MNCGLHRTREEYTKCANCGAPICEECYEMFYNKYEDKHLCENCFTELINKEFIHNKAFKKQTLLELTYIGVGIVLGLIIGASIYMPNHSIATLCTMILLPFVLGSLYTGIMWVNAKAYGAGLLTRILLFVFMIAFSPIVTVYRLITRIILVVRANKAITGDKYYFDNIKSFKDEAYQENREIYKDNSNRSKSEDEIIEDDVVDAPIEEEIEEVPIDDIILED